METWDPETWDPETWDPETWDPETWDPETWGPDIWDPAIWVCARGRNWSTRCSPSEEAEIMGRWVFTAASSASS